jgi:glycosyltransferase involved in cell wall biosynthesis
MKVVIVATYFAPALAGGVARYEREVLPRLVPLLTTAGCEVSVLVLRDGVGLESIPGVKTIRLAVGRHERFKRVLYDQIYTSFYSYKADVLLSLESWLPILPLGSRRTIVALHDANAELEWIDRDGAGRARGFPRLLYWHALARRAAVASDRVVTVSQYAAEEISRVLRIPREKIVPIYGGVDTSRLRSIRDPETLGRVRKRYSLPEEYYLFVGGSVGAKNLSLILQTYARMELRDARALPVVVTSSRPGSSPEADLLAQLDRTGKGHLFHFAGHVEADDLPVVYSAARALIFPSLHEGFGLPPVEAMACGAPVVATNRTSVPEIVGDAAILIDPENPQALLDALEKVKSEPVRSDLVAKGFERVKLFSWDLTAQRIAEEVLSARTVSEGRG